jgi:hypothetical protein
MSTLPAELNRLYRSHEHNTPNPPGAEPGLVAPDGTVRALVLELARPADWTLLSTVWRGVQTDLELPAPAIAVSGVDGYQLWFSLAEPVSTAQASAFLEALRGRYLSQVAPARIAMRPAVDATRPGHIRHALLVPALQAATGQWSAFVAPDLAAIFAQEPWLDLPPNPDAQAHVLARLQCIKPAVFQAALAQLHPAVGAETAPVTLAANERAARPASQETPTLAAPGNGLDPKGFLLGVMNNQTVELQLRIEAAKALLPYFEGRPSTII